MYFYDTCALLNLGERAFDESFCISAQTLRELEDIKTSSRKDEETKAKCRNVLRLIDSIGSTSCDITVFLVGDKEIQRLSDWGMGDTPDMQILSSYVTALEQYGDELVFVTDDHSCSAIAQALGYTVQSSEHDIPVQYTGYTEIPMTDEQQAEFYANLDKNPYGLNINEYIAVYNSSGECIDVRRWTENGFVCANQKSPKTLMFGNIKPKDIQQRMAIDSILNNTMTIITGKAGSGKSLLSLVTAFHLIETGKYSRLVVFANGTEAKGAAKMGFLPGTAREKVLGSSVGAMLSSKFGDMSYVETLINQGKIVLMPMVNCRGYEVDDNSIAFITECQNTTPELLKLCLQRCSKGCKIIIEGDYVNQVDSWMYEGNNNGLKRAIEVFQNHEDIGIVNLPRTWRSKIAEMAELLTN